MKAVQTQIKARTHATRAAWRATLRQVARGSDADELHRIGHRLYARPVRRAGKEEEGRAA